MAIKQWFLIIAPPILVGCQAIDRAVERALEHNYCPTKVAASPSLLYSGSVWGGATSRLSAEIETVVAECIRVRMPGNENIQSHYEYHLPVTADISYKTKDPAFLDNLINDSPTVVFEALSDSGVVLGTTDGRAKLIGNSTSTRASGTIVLYPEVVGKMKDIQARWAYGR